MFAEVDMRDLAAGSMNSSMWLQQEKQQFFFYPLYLTFQWGVTVLAHEWNHCTASVPELRSKNPAAPTESNNVSINNGHKSYHSDSCNLCVIYKNKTLLPW